MVTGLGAQSFEGLSFAAGYLSRRAQGPLAVTGWSWFGTGAYRVTRGGGEEGCAGGCPIQRIPDPDWDVVAAERVRD
ncbi:MAG: hypothetical protein ACR2LK_02370 [Solirubrobacteraceae bacterium]